MVSAPAPSSETTRVEARRRRTIYDTLAEQPFDDLTALAAEICGTPIGVLTLTDTERHWVRSASGLDAGDTRMLLFCAPALFERDGAFLIPDAMNDARVDDPELLLKEPSLRSFAGVVVRSSDGHPHGTIGVADHYPREFSAQQLSALRRLAHQATTLIELMSAVDQRVADLAKQEQSDADSAAQMLERSENRFREVVEHVTDVLFEQDVLGRWTFLNPAWYDITGFTVEASLGRHFFEFVHPEDAEGTRARFETLMAGGIHHGAQGVRYMTGGGHYRWMEARAKRILSCDGRPVGTIGTLRDVTTQRALADEISRAHAQAVRSSSMMSDFVANMSHEIRTPLNGVMGLTTILLDTELTPEQRQLATGAQHSLDTLLALVNDILDISKIEAGSLIIEQVPFEVRSWIAEVAEPAFVRARKKGLNVDVGVAPSVPGRLIGDPGRTRQILTNLLDNAVKFTAAGGVSVFVDECASESDQRMLRFSIKDTGIGIPAEQQTVVFEKFRQADSSTTRQYGGTGLGLAICRQLATLMDGEIGLRSETGSGSIFWFTIPLRPAAHVVETPPQTTASQRPRALQKSPEVLLVEDNATNQLVARRFLEKAGCRVDLVENGAEAVARANERVFDVIFMDCQMPVMDGYEATKRIRQGTLCAHVPIVAMTAHAMTGDRETCLAAGMTDYLSKPLKPELIAAVLERLLQPLR